MIYFTENEIDQLIKEDVPYIDLTTQLMGIGDNYGEMSFVSRGEGVVSGTELAGRIFKRLGLSTLHMKRSGERVAHGECIMSCEGNARDLHMAWKVALNVLEYSMGISTAARKLVDEARRGSASISVASTRKSMPGAKAISLGAALAGGMVPHRLGLSETFLLFDQHKVFVDDQSDIPGMIKEIRMRSPENKILVEVDNVSEAILYAEAGVDGIQFDKLDTSSLEAAVKSVKSIDDKIVNIGAGGINSSNAYDYSLTGIDVIATSSVFHAKPFDIKVSMRRT